MSAAPAAGEAEDCTPPDGGVLVAKLDAMCPDAIDKSLGPEDLEISIDKIDARTFRELDRYVNECLAKK